MNSIRPCKLCDGTFHTFLSVKTRTCMGQKVFNFSEKCWRHEENIYKNEILDYLAKTKIRGQLFSSITTVLEKINYSNQLSVSQSLKNINVPDLRKIKVPFPYDSHFGRIIIDELSKRADSGNVIYREYEIPNDLPIGLKEVAQDYYNYLKIRLEKLTLNGRPRSELYLCREMSNCIPLLKYLSKIGVKSWEGYTDDHLTDFLTETENILTSNLKRFIKYQLSKNPFMSNRGYRKKRNGSVLVEKQLCTVMDKEELNDFLESINQTLPAEYYLIAWIISKFGISYVDAVNASLDQFKIGDSGDIFYKPHLVWVKLPTSIQKKLLTITKNFNGSINLDKNYLKEINVFDLKVRISVRPTYDILKNKVSILRHTAIYNMLSKQKLDRKTISYVSGCSMKTIENVEALLSVTHNISLPAELVKKRNKVILGQNETS